MMCSDVRQGQPRGCEKRIGRNLYRRLPLCPFLEKHDRYSHSLSPEKGGGEAEEEDESINRAVGRADLARARSREFRRKSTTTTTTTSDPNLDATIRQIDRAVDGFNWIRCRNGETAETDINKVTRLEGAARSSNIRMNAHRVAICQRHPLRSRDSGKISADTRAIHPLLVGFQPANPLPPAKSPVEIIRAIRVARHDGYPKWITYIGKLLRPSKLCDSITNVTIARLTPLAAQPITCSLVRTFQKMDYICYSAYSACIPHPKNIFWNTVPVYESRSTKYGAMLQRLLAEIMPKQHYIVSGSVLIRIDSL